MAINFNQAVKYFFTEENYKKNLLIGLILYFVYIFGIFIDFFSVYFFSQYPIPIFIINLLAIPMIIIGLLIGLIIVLLFEGYFVLAISNGIRSKGFILPDWLTNYKKFLYLGFKLKIARLILYGSSLGLIIPISKNIHNTNVTDYNGILIIICTILMVVSLYFFYLQSALMLSFCMDFKFLSAFNFKRAHYLISKKPLDFFIIFTINILVPIANFIIGFVFLENNIIKIINIIIYPFLDFFIPLFFVHIYIQICDNDIVKEIENPSA